MSAPIRWLSLALAVSACSSSEDAARAHEDALVVCPSPLRGRVACRARVNSNSPEIIGAVMQLWPELDKLTETAAAQMTSTPLGLFSLLLSFRNISLTTQEPLGALALDLGVWSPQEERCAAWEAPSTRSAAIDAVRKGWEALLRLDHPAARLLEREHCSLYFRRPIDTLCETEGTLAAVRRRIVRLALTAKAGVSAGAFEQVRAPAGEILARYSRKEHVVPAGYLLTRRLTLPAQAIPVHPQGEHLASSLEVEVIDTVRLWPNLTTWGGKTAEVLAAEQQVAFIEQLPALFTQSLRDVLPRYSLDIDALTCTQAWEIP